MLLPMMFPTARSEAPSRFARRLMKSSGREVPRATMVRPMRISEAFSFFAMAEAPSTKNSAPLKRVKNPKGKKKSVRRIDTKSMFHKNIFSILKIRFWASILCGDRVELVISYKKEKVKGKK